MSEGAAFQIPTVNLNEVHLDVRENADEPGVKYLVMGPLALVLPLDTEAAEWLEQQIKGGKVQIVPASALTALPTPPAS